MSTTKAQESVYNWLKERGGSGVVDAYGRVVAGGEVRPQGSATAWLKLIAKGLIVGGENRLTIKDHVA